MLKVSYSEVNAYRMCPRSHYYGYVRRLKTKEPVKPLQFGTDFHKLMEHRDNPAKVKQILEEIAVTADEHRNAFGDDYTNNLTHIWEDYCTHWKGDTRPVETEHWFQLPIGQYKGNKVYFVGVVDEVYSADEYGAVMLGEHKTFSRAPNKVDLAMSNQPYLYAAAYEMENGVFPQWVQWDHIKSTEASAPPWLEKSKRFSKAKTQSVTEYSYRRACYEHRVEPDPEELERYRENNSHFFFRTRMELNPQHGAQVMEDFKQTARSIIKCGGKNRAQYCGMNCSWCRYQPICYAEIMGLDPEEIIAQDFLEKPTRK